MTDLALRAVLVLAVVVAAFVAARVWPRIRALRTARRPIRTEGLGPWPAVLVFTSASCDACGPARRAVREVAGEWPVRELAFEEDPMAFAAAGVEAVPLVAVVEDGGEVVGQFAGVPDRTALGRMLRRAGR